VADAWENADEDKLAELILYVADELLDDAPGGVTKINAILFVAEFSHIRAYGTPITGVAYQKVDRGPTPRRLVPVRQKMIEDGAAYFRVDDYFGRPLHRLVPERAADKSKFAASELRIVDQVVQALWGKTASDVSATSQLEMGWKLVAEGEDIPFSTAFLAKRAVLTDDIRRQGAELAQQLAL
jgi:hypothetical protein